VCTYAIIITTRRGNIVQIQEEEQWEPICDIVTLVCTFNVDIKY